MMVAMKTVTASILTMLALQLFCVPDARSDDRDELFRTDIEKMFPQLVETRRYLHAHPELSNDEANTSAYVLERLKSLGLEIQSPVAKHGIVALLKGKKEGSLCVAIRADMDALPIMEPEGKAFRSQNPGVMHACGHDVHTTVALGTAELLSKHRDQFGGTVKFLFQPAEEGMPLTFESEWGAKQMVTEGAMENPHPDAVFGLHCRPMITQAVPGAKIQYLSAGQLAYAAGPDSANSDNFEIVIQGKVSHGSQPQNGIDAVVVAAEAVTALQTIRSRFTSTREPLVLSIGIIQGGTRQNIIAGEVKLIGTVRTYDEEFRDGVVEKMHQILKGVTEAYGAGYELKYRKGYPSVFNDLELVKASLPTLQRLFGEKEVFSYVPGMGGEDFSYFAKVSPGFYFRLGVANEKKGITGEIHTAAFDVDEECLKTGVAAMAGLACDFLD